MVEKNININDDELNKLLRSSFLEEEDSKLIEEQAKFVFNQEYDVKIDQKKEQDFLNKLSGTAGGLGSSLYVIISLLIVAVIGTVFFIFNKPKEKTKTSDKEVKTEVSVAEENVVLSPKQIEEEKKYVQINEEEKKRIEEMAPEMNKELKTILYHSETPPEIPQKEITSNGLKENEYFVLNEKLIVRFKKIKQMMLEKLIKKDKKLYLSIYPGRVNYMGEDMNMTAFYIRNCAITNLEYKTFLIDLLMQGRKSDYDKAKVNSEIWKNYNMPLLAENYFKSEKYNDFPVVNISQEGALMFCNWIQEEVVKYATKTNKKVKGFTIRLPYDIEWMHLADAGFANIPNYDGYMTIFDINEG